MEDLEKQDDIALEEQETPEQAASETVDTSDEFSLEAIMREFGGEEETVTEKTPEEYLSAAEEEALKEYTPEVQLSKKETTPAVDPDVLAGGTIRFDAISDVKGTVRNAAPIDDEEDDTPVLPQEPEETTEPYSESWEPEYEQPIAEYIPPNPIPFRPRSRLRELKKKLVEGPERLYYDMAEKGFGRVQLAMLVSTLLVLLCTATTILLALDMVPDNRMRLMVFVQFWAMLLSALLGCGRLIDGAADLVKGKISLNTMLVFTFLLCCVDGILCLKQVRIPCCAAFSLQVTMSQWNEYHKRYIRMGKLDTMRKATRLDSLTAVEDYHDGNKGLIRGEGQVEDFMQTLDQPCWLDKVVRIYTIAAMAAAVTVGVGSGILHGWQTGVHVAAVTTLAALPASMFITLSRPMALLERRLHSLGTVLCGWRGVEGLSGKAEFPLDNNDLFPVGSVKLNGVKFFGNRQPDDVVAYATALVCRNGGAMEYLFTHLLDSRNGMHYEAEEFRFYEEGGIGGVVQGEPVLAGSIRFLESMGVEIPKGVSIDQAVCVAIDGELCGLFAIAYGKDRDCDAGVATLSTYSRLKSVIVTDDFMVTEDFIAERFHVKTKRFVFPEREVRAELRDRKPEPDEIAHALVTGTGLAPFAYAVTGARAVKSASVAGLIVHMVGGALGILMMLVLGYLGATELLTPVSMFLYELVWFIPGLLITEWARSI